MKKKHYSYLFLAIATVLLCIVIISHGRVAYVPIKEKLKLEKKADEHSDTIKALILYHAADYFVYQGSVIGFQYDLIKQMGKDLERPVEISIESDPEKAFLKCFSNEYDIVGFDFDKTMFPTEYLVQSDPHSFTYPVLLMRKGTSLDTNITRVVHAASKYDNHVDFKDLKSLGTWKLQHDIDVTVEDLIEMLEDTAIDYMVCNYNVAITILPFYKDLVLGPRIGENFPRTWVLNGNNQALNGDINRWLKSFKATPQYEKLCNRYLSRHSYIIQHSFGAKRNKISSYDKCMKAASARCHIDWRFMSSIIYQESHFSSDVLGMGGSFGIMQMMPSTRESYGITDTSTVEEQIWAGARYISHLYRIFENKVDTAEIYYFVAGAYNSGPGHILDAMALCKKYGEDSQHWDNVSKYLILKSHKEYYSDPVVKCGYYPGKHTLNYVREVMNRYNGYVITKKEE